VAGAHYRSDIPTPADVREVRHRILDWARATGLPGELTEVLVLAGSELATNAVRHARTAFELTIEHVDGTLELQVFDADTRLPQLAGTDDDAVSGRGIQIVSAIADDWGSGTEERDGVTGKVVWARFVRDEG
jgi:anti-sigma regulatory factor (Ser/Thr protein kinase)